MVHQRPATPRRESVAKPEPILLIFLNLVFESDIKEGHGKLCNPFFEKNARGQIYHREIDKCKEYPVR